MTTRGLDHVDTIAPPSGAGCAITGAFHAAIVAAQAFAGATAPNPPVGCVVLDAAGAMLACEAHARAGAPHAEAAAIAACRRIGAADRIHTIVVTLEPCNHFGRTPPCVEAILATLAQAVWIGVRDPNPRVAGDGATRLVQRGLKVGFLGAMGHPDAARLSRAASRLIAPFRTWSLHGRPWLTLKQAINADGGMAPPVGRTTFTSPASLRLAHRLRRRADAIITGSGCILADNPAFTVRHLDDHVGKSRILAILDRRGRTPAAYVSAAEARGFDVRVRGDITDLLAELARDNVLEALVEAGPSVLDAFVRQGLWDERVIIRQSRFAGCADDVEFLTAQPAI